MSVNFGGCAFPPKETKTKRQIDSLTRARRTPCRNGGRGQPFRRRCIFQTTATRNKTPPAAGRMRKGEKMKKSDIKKIIQNGGATLAKNGRAVNFRNGYQVSKKDCYILSVENVGQLADKINALFAEIGKNEFVGIWVDAGAVYVDISERIGNEKKALNIARQRKQKSVYDWGNACCLWC